jgi:hypothetical protein
MRIRRNWGAFCSVALLGLTIYGCKSEARQFDAPDESGGAAGEGNSDPTGSGGTAGTGTAGTGNGGTAGGTPECSDNEAECLEGEATARVCRNGAWQTTACEGETPLCSKGRCVSCEPGAEECRNDVAHRCDEDGSWESLNACSGNTIECPDCTLGQECSGEGDCGTGYCLEHTCVECEPATGECVGLTPRLCSNDGTWVNQPPCSGELPLCDADTGACVCEEDEHSCVDADTERRCVDGAWTELDCRQGCLTGQGVDACRTDTVATAGLVACDYSSDTTCDVSGGNVCCLMLKQVPQHVCTAAANCPDPTGSSDSTFRNVCDGDNDCPEGQGCCYQEYMSVNTFCTASAATCHDAEFVQQRRVCDPDGAPCPEGRICTRRVFKRASEKVDEEIFTCEDP